MMRFTIPGRLASLNDYTASCRSNAHVGNAMKKKQERLITDALTAQQVKPVENYPVILNIIWYESSERRDVDNITFAVKFVMDALKACGVIVDDSRRYVTGINHTVKTDKSNPRIEVEIKEGADHA